MTDQVQTPTPSASPSPTAVPIYSRPQGWKRLIKPFAVRAISAFWVKWYRLRLGDRVRFGRNFQTNGRLVIKGPGRVVFGDDINAWCHAEKNVFITYTPSSLISIGSGTRLNG